MTYGHVTILVKRFLTKNSSNTSTANPQNLGVMGGTSSQPKPPTQPSTQPLKQPTKPKHEQQRAEREKRLHPPFPRCPGGRVPSDIAIQLQERAQNAVYTPPREVIARLSKCPITHQGYGLQIVH